MSLKAILLPAAFALSFAACATEGPSPAVSSMGPSAATGAAPKAAPVRADVRVGLLLPLSGAYAEVGQALLNAAAVSVFDTGDSRLLLLPRDSKGTAEGAQVATAELLAAGVDIIIGPLLAGEVRAAAALLQAEQADVRLIGFSSDRGAATNGAYLLSFTPEEEVRRVVSYAVAEGKKSFAALVPESPYGQTVGRAFRDNVTAAGGQVTDYVVYPPDAKGVMEPVKRVARYDLRNRNRIAENSYLKTLGEDPEALASARATRPDPMALPYQALLLPEGAALMRVIAPLLSYYEVDVKSVQLLGTGLWNDPALAREPQLQGAWFAAPPQDKAQAFLDRYRSFYRSEPPRIATLAYDAVALVGLLAKADEFGDAALMDRAGFTGIDGIFRFGADGVAERGLAVMTFGVGGISTLSPAPSAFESPAP